MEMPEQEQMPEQEEEEAEEAGFELREEEYAEDGENVEKTLPQQWWSFVNDVCDQVGDGGSDGVRSESDLESLCSDEEEQTKRKSKREYNPRRKQSDFSFKLGMIFPTIEHLREVLKEEFIKIDREFKYVFNDKTRLRAVCKGRGCGWVLYARVVGSDNKTVRVNTLVDTHDCGIVFYNKLVTCTWLSEKFFDQFRLNPSMEYNCFKEMVAATKFSNVSRDVFYIARKYAREKLEGSVSDQFAVLEDYCRQLKTNDPGIALGIT